MPTFGRYETLDKIGEGAMGVVYRARDTALGRVVALKTLSSYLGADEELHQRFQREAEAIGRLSHPNIVTVYDLGEHEGHVYMAMELLEGEDLRSLIERRREVPLADRVRILLQIGQGLAYAHARGVVHRDVKPANILVTSTGRVKLLDFGLARVAARETITRQGIILGTPDYMSPEQATCKTIDHRTDIFSAGAVFYEFLTYRKPFPGKSLHAVLYRIVQDDPDPLLSMSPELPARLALLVDRMLEKSPERRYQSMQEVAAELGGIHAALRRSHSRSALPAGRAGASSPAGEEGRARARDLLARGRKHFDAGRWTEAASAASAALAFDPDCEEAAEMLWGAEGKLGARGVPSAPSREQDARIEDLLSRVGPDAPEPEARRALAELALIAPDDPRLAERIRERTGSRR